MAPADSVDRSPQLGDALLVVDVQNDFLPEGALAVPGGDEILPEVNRLIDEFVTRGLPVVLSRDWHPPDHCSFEAEGGVWPPHCIRDTYGAEFAQGLRMPLNAAIISKATRRDEEAYSAFEGTDLDRILTERKVTRLFVVGLATDYCVLASVRDARRLGYEVVVPAGGIRAVDVHPDDGPRAIEEMRKSGADVLDPAS